MIKNVIFDFDGVLVDSEMLARKAVSRFLSSKNILFTEQDFTRYFTGNKFTEVIDTLTKKLKIKDPKIFYDEMMNLAQKIYSEELTIVPGAHNFLNILQQKKLIGSNRGKKSIIQGLTKVGLDNFFEEKYIFSYEMVQNPKPSPDIYLKVIDVTDIKPEETIVIEDSAIGVKAAFDAKIKVIGITAGGHWINRSENSLLDAGAFTVSDTFEGILKIINKL